MVGVVLWFLLWLLWCNRCSDSYGVSISVMVSDSSMLVEVLIGIGCMYGFISLDMNVIGSSVVIMVKVVRMVGLLILFIVLGIVLCSVCLFSVMCWWMFFIIMMVLFIRMLMEKISVNNDIWLMVKFIVYEVNRVSISVIIIVLFIMMVLC